jgi:hypothetical protein
MKAKNPAKRKPRTWTRWAVVKDYGPHGMAFLTVTHQGYLKSKAKYLIGPVSGERLMRVRITEVR